MKIHTLIACAVMAAGPALAQDKPNPMQPSES